MNQLYYLIPQEQINFEKEFSLSNKEINITNKIANKYKKLKYS